MIIATVTEQLISTAPTLNNVIALEAVNSVVRRVAHQIVTS